MRTQTITSVTVPGQGTWAITSNVTESTESALDHVREMGKGMKVEPHYVTYGLVWRWTWEYVDDRGFRCADTVRLIP